MKAVGLMICRTVLVLKHSLMVLNMRETTKTLLKLVRVNILGLMVRLTKGIGVMIRFMGLVLISGRMVASTLGTGLMGKCVDTGSIFMLMGCVMMVSIKTIKKMDLDIINGQKLDSILEGG